MCSSHFHSNVDARVAREGEITTWIYYSVFGGEATFQVWRQTGNSTRYLLYIGITHTRYILKSLLLMSI